MYYFLKPLLLLSSSSMCVFSESFTCSQKNKYSIVENNLMLNYEFIEDHRELWSRVCCSSAISTCSVSTYFLLLVLVESNI